MSAQSATTCSQPHRLSTQPLPTTGSCSSSQENDAEVAARTPPSPSAATFGPPELHRPAALYLPPVPFFPPGRRLLTRHGHRHRRSRSHRRLSPFVSRIRLPSTRLATLCQSEIAVNAAMARAVADNAQKSSDNQPIVATVRPFPAQLLSFRCPSPLPS